MPTKKPNEPANKNFLSPVGFRFGIQRLPNVNWFIQAANLPGINLGEATMVTPFVDGAFPGDKLIYDNLNIRFKVDEDLKNWEELQNWMVGLGFPESFDQYVNLSATLPGQDNKFSDGTLTILNSQMRSNYTISFKDMFPVSLSELSFDSSAADIDYLTADASFKYLTYTYKKIATPT